MNHSLFAGLAAACMMGLSLLPVSQVQESSIVQASSVPISRDIQNTDPGYQYSEIRILYADHEGIPIADGYEYLEIDGDEPFSLDLTKLDLTLPSGYILADDASMLEVLPGTCQNVTVYVKSLQQETTLNISYMDGDDKVDEQTLTAYEPVLSLEEYFSFSDLSIPEGYVLSSGNSASFSEIEVPAGQETDLKLAVEAKEKVITISYVDKTGKVIKTQKFVSEDGVLNPSDLLLPDNRKLAHAFDTLHYSNGDTIDIDVLPCDPLIPSTVFTIVYKTPYDWVLSSQTISFAIEEGVATVGQSDLILPDGYALSEDFENITIRSGEKDTITLEVERTTPEAVYFISYMDSDGNVIGKEELTYAKTQNHQLTLADLSLPDGYEMVEEPELPEPNYARSQSVVMTVQPVAKSAWFDIHLVDEDGNEIARRYVQVIGRQGVANLDLSILDLPEGYELADTSQAWFCRYNSRLEITLVLVSTNS